MKSYSSRPTWSFLKPGDIIDVIAPSSPPNDYVNAIKKIKEYFASRQLNVRIPDGLIDPTPVLNEANTIEKRIDFIKKALASPDSKVLWAIIGGGWGAELLDRMKAEIPPGSFVKPVLGYSDATNMHVFFNQCFDWPSIHCVELAANGDIIPGWNKTTAAAVLDILSGKTPEVSYTLTLLNPKKFPNLHIEKTAIIGGNSLVVNCLNGSDDFSLDTKGKIVFLESIARGVGEDSRMLSGMRYSPAVKNASGVILGSFIVKGGVPNTPEEEAGFKLIRQYFADHLDIPVMHADIFGHGPINQPLPLNTRAEIRQISATQVNLSVSANNRDY